MNDPTVPVAMPVFGDAVFAARVGRGVDTPNGVNAPVAPVAGELVDADRSSAGTES